MHIKPSNDWQSKIEIGLQAWSCRNLIAVDPQEAFTKSACFDFIELAGHGSEDIKTFSTHKGIPTNKIKGAHICSLNNSTEEIFMLVDAYLDHFSNLEWIVFYFNYRKSGKTDSFLLDSKNNALVNTYTRYAETIKLIEQRYSENPLGPKVIYHLYPVDFIPVDFHTIGNDLVPKPAFEILLEHGINIQIDIHFARLVGFDLTAYFRSFSKKRFLDLFFKNTTQDWETIFYPLIHSMHLAGFNEKGKHEPFYLSTCNCDESQDRDRRYECPVHYFKDLLEVAELLNCSKLILEFEHDPDLTQSIISKNTIKNMIGI